MTQTILVVEDDMVFRTTVLVPKLEEQGYQVLQAGKVREAEPLLKQHDVDLLIVDGLLPDKSGIDFIAALRAQGVQVPTIFLSAFWKDMKTFKELSGMGVAHVLHKPIDAADLCDKVAKMLGTSSSDAADA